MVSHLQHPEPRLIAAALIASIIMVFMAYIGVVCTGTLVRNKRTFAGVLFALLCFSCVSWIGFGLLREYFCFSQNAGGALLARNFSNAITLMIVLSLLFFTNVFFAERSPPYAPVADVVIAVLSILFMAGSFTSLDIKAVRFTEEGRRVFEYGWLHYLLLPFAVGFFAYMVHLLYFKRRHADNLKAGYLLRFMLIGVMVSLLTGIVFNLVFPLLGNHDLYFFGALAPACGLFFFSRAILKDSRMSISDGLLRSTTWFFAVTLLVIPLYALTYSMAFLFSAVGPFGLSLLITLIVLISYLYIRDLQPRIRDWFSPDEHKVRKDIAAFVREIGVLKDVATVARQFIEFSKCTFDLSEVKVLVVGNNPGETRIFSVPRQRLEVARLSDAEKRALQLHGNTLLIAGVIGPANTGLLAELAETLQARVLVPLCADRKLLGILVLGSKLRDEPFHQWELSVLEQSQSGFAEALRNALIHESHLGNQARSLQTELIAAASSALVHSIKNRIGLLSIGIEELREIPGLSANRTTARVLSDMEREIGGITRVVHKIREARVSPLEMIRCDLHYLLNQALAQARQNIEARDRSWGGVRLDGKSSSAVIAADMDQLKLAFVNIFENALQSLSPSGTMIIRTDIHMSDGASRTACVTVRDTGSGMDEEFVSRVTNRPFVTTKESGTGLGVWTAKRIVEAHGGSFSIASVVGTGTTVTVRLPVVSQEWSSTTS